jgi:hypothetical protein
MRWQLGIVLLVLATGQGWPQQETVENFKRGFIERLNNECLVAQRGKPENETISQAEIKTFCSCLSTHGAEVITTQDLYDDVAGNGRNLQIKLDALGKTCAEDLVLRRQGKRLR